MSPLRLALFISVIAVSARWVPGQQSPNTAPVSTQSPATPSDDSDRPVPTLHVTSRLVVLDVVVTDASGNPVHGLKSSDFTLLEDGIPQPLASLTEHDATHLAEPASPLPLNTFAVQHPPTEEEAKTVIVLADPTRWPTNSSVPEFPSGTAVNTGYVRNDIAAFLTTAPSTQPVAIVRIDWQGMHLVQGLTTDRNVLTEAIASKRMEPPLGFVVSFTHGRGNASQQLVRYVNSIPGHVNLVWITYGGSMPGNPIHDFPDLASVVHDLNGPSQALHLSRVAPYPIPLNQQGLGAGLAQMATAAGGHLYLTGIRQALSEIAAIGAEYYTLSYVPTNSDWNGAFRKIKVNIAGFPQPPPPEPLSSEWSEFLGWTERQKSKLIYRPGYFARTASSPAEEAVHAVQSSRRPRDPHRKLPSYSPKGDAAGYNAETPTAIQRAMQFGSLPLDRIEFTLNATASADTVKLKPNASLSGKDTLIPPFSQDAYRNVRISYRMDPHSLTFAQDSLGGYYDSLQFIAVVYRDDGTPANSIHEEEQIQIPAGGLARALNTTITFDQTIAVPVDGNPIPGNFFLRVGVAERPSGHIGTLEVPTEWIKLPYKQTAGNSAAADRASSNSPQR
jgi:VWFA-related protein